MPTTITNWDVLQFPLIQYFLLWRQKMYDLNPQSSASALTRNEHSKDVSVFTIISSTLAPFLPSRSDLVCECFWDQTEKQKHVKSVSTYLCKNMVQWHSCIATDLSIQTSTNRCFCKHESISHTLSCVHVLLAVWISSSIYVGANCHIFMYDRMLFADHIKKSWQVLKGCCLGVPWWTVHTCCDSQGADALFSVTLLLISKGSNNTCKAGTSY